MNPCDMETVSGKIINLEKPEPGQICIKDISWSLSRIVRFTGHTVQEIPYSVGQHSIQVGIRAEQLARERAFQCGFSERDIVRIALYAHLHDAGEAYTGDISGPLKKHPDLRPIIKKIEKEIDETIEKGLDLPLFNSEHERSDAEKIIKEADVYCQAIEAYNFMCSRGLSWNVGEEISLVEYQRFEMPKSNVEIYERFLERYESLIQKWRNLG